MFDLSLRLLTQIAIALPIVVTFSKYIALDIRINPLDLRRISTGIIIVGMFALYAIGANQFLYSLIQLYEYMGQRQLGEILAIFCIPLGYWLSELIYSKRHPEFREATQQNNLRKTVFRVYYFSFGAFIFWIYLTFLIMLIYIFILGQKPVF